jgi:hypothetical protein
MYKPLNARPNLNGNTREDFGAAYVELSKARDAIAQAQAYLLGNVAHGRNYQHLDDPTDALIADRRSIHETCRDAWALLGALQSSLVDALENSAS